MNHIGFRNLKRYKYQLMRDYKYQTTIRLNHDVKIQSFIMLTTTGLLIIYKGYAWDGPSGPTIDTKNFMRGSLVHDALYQLMRMKLLSVTLKNLADRLLRQICREDGMNWLRAWYVYWCVRLFAKSAATKPRESDTKIIEAP
ncbi:MAG: hypothetical protein A2W27_03660 [Deltaproteobacteria bacterium RBG_16_44_11]|nr:MAG: hypothetical protein A2W27_03660 [Deltaproteobacteria bacterium RBG_16_44_11]